jgi:DNA-binding transcriptional ArsR family regulator
MELQAMRPDDWPAVREIYQAAIATGEATFETTTPDWEAWDAGHLDEHRLVARVGGQVVGWAALAPVSDRCAYAGVAEDSIYNLLATSPDPVCVCEFTGPLGLSQPTVSHHLKKLVEVGLLERAQRGIWAYYSLGRDTLGRLAAAVDLQGARR